MKNRQSKEKALRKPLTSAACKAALAAVCPASLNAVASDWKRISQIRGNGGSTVRFFSLRGHPILGSVSEENERITLHLKAIEPDQAGRN